MDFPHQAGRRIGGTPPIAGKGRHKSNDDAAHSMPISEKLYQPIHAGTVDLGEHAQFVDFSSLYDWLDGGLGPHPAVESYPSGA